MIFVQTVALMLAVLSTLTVLSVLRRARRAVRIACGSAAMGLGALAAVNLLGAYTGVVLAVNYATAFVAVVLGAPGVVLLLWLRVLLLF